MYKLCLNMIVKDESQVILETLENVRKYIDYWVICDTGSTDGTQKLIQDYFDEHQIPGELLQHEWKNFGHNRSEALRACRGKAQFVFVMDADDLIVGDLDLSNLDQGLAGYEMRLGKYYSYMRILLFNMDYDWYFSGVLHEYADCKVKGAVVGQVNGNYYIDSRRLGNRNQGLSIVEKYQKDAAVLEQALVEEPNNTRYMFYLAQSYFDAKDFQNSMKWYQKRVDAGGWFEEVYYSMYRVAECMHRMNWMWSKVKKAYLRAHEYRPQRAEALHTIAFYCRQIGAWEEAYHYARRCCQIPMPSDRVYVFRDVYEFKRWDELIVSAYRTRRHKEAYDACLKLLSEGKMPEEYRGRIERNMWASRRYLEGRMKRPIVCFYTGYAMDFNLDNYQDPKMGCYGSEIALMELCKCLRERYSVFVFGPNVQNENIIGNIWHFNSCRWEEFSRTHSVDVLVISRYMNFYLEHEARAKQTYIWLHDLIPAPHWRGQELPDAGAGLLKNILGTKSCTGLICLTNFHRGYVMRRYGISGMSSRASGPCGRHIYILGNGVATNRLSNSPSNSMANKWIWTSYPARGLKYAVELFKRIHQVHDYATFHVYRGEDCFNTDELRELLEEIKESEFMFFHGKVEHDVLSEKFNEADVWLYPTDFLETYCMSALEAQLGGCLCIYTPVGALVDTVGDRGYVLPKVDEDGFYERALEQILRLLNSPEVVKEYREKARLWAETQTWPNIVNQWVQLFGSKDSAVYG